MYQLHGAFIHPERWLHDGNHVHWLHHFHGQVAPQGEAQSEAGEQPHDVLDYRSFNWQMQCSLASCRALWWKCCQRERVLAENCCHLSYPFSALQTSDSAQVQVTSRVFIDGSFDVGCLSKGREHEVHLLLNIRIPNRIQCIIMYSNRSKFIYCCTNSIVSSWFFASRWLLDCLKYFLQYKVPQACASLTSRILDMTWNILMCMAYSLTGKL